MRTCVLGAGSFGTALSAMLAWNGHMVSLWGRDLQAIEAMQKTRHHPRYLPFLRLPESVYPTADLSEALDRAELVVCALPSGGVRSVMDALGNHLSPGTILLLASKGIESHTLLTMTELVSDCLPSLPPSHVAVMSGPSFADELARKQPTAVTVASTDDATSRFCQQALQSDVFRLYTSRDVVGVQLGGALKNVVAIAAGICDGLGYGENARAALITRGLAEITRLAVSRGAEPTTLAGLSGVGDLMLTCAGALSRNRRVGIELGKGRTLAEALVTVGTVAEGVSTSGCIPGLARQSGVELPICEQVCAVVHENKDPRQAVAELMSRQPKSEGETCEPSPGSTPGTR